MDDTTLRTARQVMDDVRQIFRFPGLCGAALLIEKPGVMQLILRFPPQQMALYLFLCEHANTEAGQDRFDLFGDTLARRHQIAACLRRCGVGGRKPKGLSCLAFPESTWPDYWREDVDASDGLRLLRKKEMDSAFSRLRSLFDEHDLLSTSFTIQKRELRENPRTRAVSHSTRWVSIQPKRLRVIE